jgi:hypothetical protein
VDHKQPLHSPHDAWAPDVATAAVEVVEASATGDEVVDAVVAATVDDGAAGVVAAEASWMRQYSAGHSPEAATSAQKATYFA